MALETGLLLTTTMPQSLRDFYSAQLLDVLRTQTIFQQLALEVEDLAAVNTKQLVLTKVLDLHPAIGALTEGEPWLTGAFLNSKQYTLTIREHGNTIKFNRFHTKVQYWNDGEMQGLVRDKLGRNISPSSVNPKLRNATSWPVSASPPMINSWMPLSSSDFFLRRTYPKSPTNDPQDHTENAPISLALPRFPSGTGPTLPQPPIANPGASP